MHNTCMLLYFTFIIPLTSTQRPFAHTEYGDVFGMEWSSFKGRKFHAYLSIPFAEKPLGKLRFEDPVEPKPWSIPIDGSVWTPACIQTKLPDTHAGQEDCLYINVFTPNVNILLSQSKKQNIVKKKLNLRNITDLIPVVVYIPGGAFNYYSGLTFGPRYILDKDMIFVSFNYRLGIFGFLCTEDEVVPGNAAMKDQIMALRWLQRNIHNFGGDPSSITILGMSAGAASVHMHFFSMLSRGLFQKGYMIGGTSLNIWAMQKMPLEKARVSAEWVGCPVTDSRRMVACLKAIPAPLLVRTTDLFMTTYGPLCPWAPVVDHWSKVPFLTEYPLISILRRRHYNVPLIVSDTTSAGLFPTALFMGDAQLAELDLNWENLAPHMLDTVETLDKDKTQSVMGYVRRHYFGRDPVYKNITRLIKLMTDRLFLSDMSMGVSQHASINPRIHVYMFNYRGGFGSADNFLEDSKNLGVAHVDDLYYIMNKTSHEPVEDNKSDIKMIERMTEMLYQFCKTGQAVFIPGVHWPAQRGPSASFTYLKVDSPDSATMVSTDNFGDSSFWNSLPLREPWAGRGLLEKFVN